MESDHEEQKNSTSLWTKIEGFAKRWKDVVAVIVATVPLGYFILNRVYQKIYQTDCEAFFHIPRRYFVTDIGDKLLYFLLLLAMVLLLLLPIYYRKLPLLNKAKPSFIDDFLISLLFAVEMGLIGVQSFEIIVHRAGNNDNLKNLVGFVEKHYDSISWILVVIVSISMPLYVISNRIKKEKVKKALKVISTVLVTIGVVLLVSGFIVVLTSSVEDERRYEIVTVGKEEYVVLSTIDEKELIANCSIDYTIDCNNNQSITMQISVEDYRFIEEHSGKNYRYIRLTEAPKMI